MKVNKQVQPFRYLDIVKWEEPHELYDGIPIPLGMAPAPNTGHQRIVGKLYHSLYVFLQNTPCEVFVAPFDVRLDQDRNYENSETVVQPDISVFCNPEQIDEAGAKGAPTFVVEVLSKSTLRRDRVQKFNIYCKYGVNEYWIIDPNFNSIEIYELVDDTFQQKALVEEGQEAASSVLKGFTFSL